MQFATNEPLSKNEAVRYDLELKSRSRCQMPRIEISIVENSSNKDLKYSVRSWKAILLSNGTFSYKRW